MRSERQSVQVSCNVSGEPTPSVSWTKNGEDVVPSSHVDVRGRDLVIGQAAMLDSGIYQCWAENIAGHVVLAARVLVQMSGIPACFTARCVYASANHAWRRPLRFQSLCCIHREFSYRSVGERILKIGPHRQSYCQTSRSILYQTRSLFVMKTVVYRWSFASTIIVCPISINEILKKFETACRNCYIVCLKKITGLLLLI